MDEPIGISLRDRVKDTLDECRILVLCVQVLLGFFAESVLQSGFRDLSPMARGLSVAGMCGLAATLGLLLWPAAYHQVVLRGHDDSRLVEFASNVLVASLLPFGAALGVSMTVACERTVGTRAAAAVGGACLILSVLLWYVLPRTRAAHRKEGPVVHEPADPVQRVQHLLTETRVVLPGVQALLGFATLGALTGRFETLPRELKVVHMTGLLCLAVSLLLLVAPAAFHRVAEHGQPTARFLRVGALLLLLGMAALAPGVAASVWMVIEVATGSRWWGCVAAIAVVVVYYALWFGWTGARRRELQTREHS